MIVAFARQELIDLFLGDSKLYRSQPDVLRGFFRVMDILLAAESDQDLRALGSLDFKALHGQEEGNVSSSNRRQESNSIPNDRSRHPHEAFGDFHK